MLFTSGSIIFRLFLPPIRERQEDILPLFNHFLKEAAEDEHKPLPLIEKSVPSKLQGYGRNGNVREIQNVARRLMALQVGSSISEVDCPIRYREVFRGALHSRSCLKSISILRSGSIPLLFVHWKKTDGTSPERQSISISREIPWCTGWRSGRSRVMQMGRCKVCFRSDSVPPVSSTGSFFIGRSLNFRQPFMFSRASRYAVHSMPENSLAECR
jgi:hypothetical protein